MAPGGRKLAVMNNELNRAPVYIALVHYPVYNKNAEVIATAVTNADIHDISRSCRTFGVQRYYIVTPLESQKKVTRDIIKYWTEGFGAEYNWTRKEALALIEIVDSIESAKNDIKDREGRFPMVVATSARPDSNSISFRELKRKILESSNPVLLLMGTGWGLSDAVLQSSDLRLQPIAGSAGYNHLSVRSALAIILDRLLGERGE